MLADSRERRRQNVDRILRAHERAVAARVGDFEPVVGVDFFARLQVEDRGAAVLDDDAAAVGVERELGVDERAMLLQQPLDAPLLADATNVLNMPSVLSYDTASGLTDAAAFYQKQIPDLGWALIGEPDITDTVALLDFTQGDQKMSVIITVRDTGTNVQILLGKAQE